MHSLFPETQPTERWLSGYRLHVLIWGTLLLAIMIVAIVYGDRGGPKGEPLNVQNLIDETLLENALQQQHSAWQALGDSSLAVALNEPLYCPRLLRGYYSRQLPLLWVAPKGLNRQGQELLARLKDAGAVGLMPQDYHLPLLDTLNKQVVRNKTAKQYLQLEYLLTDAYCLYLMHLRTGKMDSTAWQAYWDPKVRDPKFDYIHSLEQVHHTGSLSTYLTRFEPQHPHFRQLQAAMRYYLKLQASIGRWDTLPQFTKISPGETHYAIPLLRRRLRATQELAKGADTVSAVYDSVLVQAVKRFQRTHGLNDDGVLAKNTRAALNISLADLIEILRLNLQRWRWVPADWGERYIWVNIPEYRLYVYEKGKLTKDMRVIVGRKKRPSPFLSSEISNLIFNPYWSVPSKMIEEDIVPQLMSNPEYLTRMGMKLVDKEGQQVALDSSALSSLNPKTFPYAVVQDPGWGNSLGRVMFTFPNNYQVYLHDTPDKWAFVNDERALSSGCIRVQHPMDLTDLLMRDEEGWNEKKRQKLLDEVDKTSHKPKYQHLKLPKPYRVHIYYFTARVDERRTIYFFADVYERDKRHLRILHQRHPATYTYKR